MRILFLIGFALTVFACKAPLPSGVQTIGFAFSASQNANIPEKETALIAALQKRFETAYPHPVKIQSIGKNDYEIVLPGQIDENKLAALIETQGRLFFAETTAAEAVIQSFRGAGLTEKLAGKLNWEISRYQANSPVIGYANPRDTAFISQEVANADRMGIIKSGFSTAWGQVPIMTGAESAAMMELFAIKEQNGQYQGMGGVMLTEVKAEADQTGQWALWLSFDEANSQAWAKLTEKRTNDYIAMLIDGKAWSVPRVNSPITGGKTMITGQWTESEAKLWTAIISNPLAENIQLTKLNFDPNAVWEP